MKMFSPASDQATCRLTPAELPDGPCASRYQAGTLQNSVGLQSTVCVLPSAGIVLVVHGLPPSGAAHVIAPSERAPSETAESVEGGPASPDVATQIPFTHGSPPGHRAPVQDLPVSSRLGIEQPAPTPRAPRARHAATTSTVSAPRRESNHESLSSRRPICKGPSSSPLACFSTQTVRPRKAALRPTARAAPSLCALRRARAAANERQRRG